MVGSVVRVILIVEEGMTDIKDNIGEDFIFQPLDSTFFEDPVFEVDSSFHSKVPKEVDDLFLSIHMPNIDGNGLLAGDLSQLFEPGGQGDFHGFCAFGVFEMQTWIPQ